MGCLPCLQYQPSYVCVIRCWSVCRYHCSIRGLLFDDTTDSVVVADAYKRRVVAPMDTSVCFCSSAGMAGTPLVLLRQQRCPLQAVMPLPLPGVHVHTTLSLA